MKQIKEKASYCLNCKTKPCALKGCPIQTQIPEFITEVKNENYKKAFDILKENNICSYICSLVCPQEEQCEGSCIRGIKAEATHIGELEKFVNEWAIDNGYEYKLEIEEQNGKNALVIGTGPAGIVVASELLKAGFEVDMYERDEIPGGILTYGIPDFRLSKDKVENVFNELKSLGAKIYTGKELGKDFSLEEVSKKYDVVFLGIGAQKSTIYPLHETEKAGVYKSDEFLKAYNENKFIKDLGKVVVIGGGNVAMDSARAAIKMGANEVKILYRRDRAHMPAREVELDEALQDGVIFEELTRVSTANYENGRMVSLNCVRTEIVDGKAVDKEPEYKFEVEANTVVFAIGLKPNKSLLETEGVKLDDWGYIEVDEDGRTNIENVYAGGDVTESKATVCRALAAGKKAAKGIIKNI